MLSSGAWNCTIRVVWTRRRGFCFIISCCISGCFLHFFENLLITLFRANNKKMVYLYAILLTHPAASSRLVSNVLPCQLFRRLSANFSEFRQYYQESEWYSPVLFNREVSLTRITKTSCHAIPQELSKTVSLMPESFAWPFSYTTCSTLFSPAALKPLGFGVGTLLVQPWIGTNIHLAFGPLKLA